MILFPVSPFSQGLDEFYLCVATGIRSIIHQTLGFSFLGTVLIAESTKHSCGEEPETSRAGVIWPCDLSAGRPGCSRLSSQAWVRRGLTWGSLGILGVPGSRPGHGITEG